MPIYEYFCDDCKDRFEIRFISTLSDEVKSPTVEMVNGKPKIVARTHEIPSCPKCGGNNVKRRFGPFNFKI